MSVTPNENTFNARTIAAEAEAKGENPLAVVIFQALGAASACWEHLDTAGIFESDRARDIGVDLLVYVSELVGPANDRAEVYRTSSGRWRYRIIAGNNKVVDAPIGQTYATKWGAQRAARRGRSGIPVAVVNR